MRQQRLSHVEKELKEVELQLGYASRQRERCANVNNFTKAIEMSKEMEELCKKKRKYQEEVTSVDQCVHMGPEVMCLPEVISLSGCN